MVRDQLKAAKEISAAKMRRSESLRYLVMWDSCWREIVGRGFGENKMIGAWGRAAEAALTVKEGVGFNQTHRP